MKDKIIMFLLDKLAPEEQEPQQKRQYTKRGIPVYLMGELQYELPKPR